MEIAALIFVIFLIAVAAITFFVLKRAVRMTIRATIVALVLRSAVVGSVSLWWFGSSDKTSDKTPVTNKKSR